MATTSEKGIATLDLLEGVVLKAYRDAVGRWTIGSGLTKASGVIDPKPGMVISRKESDRLTRLALARNYEPAVNKAMPGASQNEFDAGSLFQWNTGAIGRASWVRVWRNQVKDWGLIGSKMRAWNKGGGKVLPGLTRRRQIEFDILRFGIYPVTKPNAPATGLARIVVSIEPARIATIRAAFAKLGYEPGKDPSGISRNAVKTFQRDHDLTVDGVIGKATLSTLQRMIDARAKAAAPAATAVAAGGFEAAPMPDGSIEALSGLPHADWIVPAVLVLALGWAAWRAWQYRDAIAVKAQNRFPQIAAKLRSI
ncbi:Phage-related lysozyme (muraminidase) [Thalassovita gelatinovora]|uniref:Lysozyme n=1 Tax=Thalassovita gelatinovora TaxID=53501 RepID=A0A0P1FJR3_THAGE|nr:peptidoglycan-binding protein [Thalassovita gelatinovora]QIZ81576.1 glycoside hydrolase family protein [Thalassovita gelatinovora]CUH68006.1 Phage-related lysozyme (muraminidase) [Thalassovita gelatinovora]SEQ27276.1 lysozyme [Thalassovita gelatinovora]